MFVNTTWSQEHSSPVKPFNLAGFSFSGYYVLWNAIAAKFHVSSFALSDDCCSAPQTCRTTHFKLKEAGSDHLSTKAIKTNSTVNDAAGILTPASPRETAELEEMKEMSKKSELWKQVVPSTFG